ncbi:MAG: flagellin lysine-N-methylase [Chitinispirillales bacterium]|nr:flagellin lysine-N-methylase [Chitinispirillales bacterium]
MPKKKKEILQPEYMSRFICIGGACEDNCCADPWNIFVDKKTFLKYRDVKDQEIKAVLDKVVKRYRGKDASDMQYASFRLRREGGVCAFLTQEQTCYLQAKLGYENLCDVCAIYPRQYKIADKKLERAATMSCPEVVRMALDNPEGIAFETIEEGPTTGRIPARAPSIDTKNTKFAAKPAKWFWEIRLYCLSILQNRLYTLSQRFIILGMLCQKLDEYEREGRVEEIPAMLGLFGAGVEDGSLKPELDAVPGNFQIQLKFAKELTDNRLRSELVASRIYMECVKETLAGLNFFVDTPAADILEKYVSNRDDYVSAYLKEKEYVLENFFVNESFMNMMPFNTNTCWESYLHMCVLYGMLKLHLNGMAGHHKGLTDEVVFRLIQSFAKVVIHNKNFIPNMVKLIKESEFDTLAWMTILVND